MSSRKEVTDAMLKNTLANSFPCSEARKRICVYNGSSVMDFPLWMNLCGPKRKLRKKKKNAHTGLKHLCGEKWKWCLHMQSSCYWLEEKVSKYYYDTTPQASWHLTLDWTLLATLLMGWSHRSVARKTGRLFSISACRGAWRMSPLWPALFAYEPTTLSPLVKGLSGY